MKAIYRCVSSLFTLTALAALVFMLGSAGVISAHAATRIPTVTSLGFSAYPAAGRPLTVIATVTPANATGTVAFTGSFGKSRLALPAACANVPVSGGTAACTFTPAGTGTYAFTAKFSDAKIYASSTGNGSVAVKLATSTGLSFSGSPVVGSPVTVTAAVSPAAATGTVSFAATIAGNAVSLPAGCASAAMSGGQASCTFTPATTGPFSFTATYSGNASYAGSLASNSLSPARIVTQTSISFSTSPSTGSPLTVTATVSPAATGTVDFTATLGGNPVMLPAACTSASLSSAGASCTFTPSVAGSYSFAAASSGDVTYAPSSGNAQVSVLTVTTTLVTDNATTVPGGPAPVTFGGTILFTATVSSASGAPNGTVRWTLSHDAPHYGIPDLDNNIAVASGTVGACQGEVPVVNGVATCSVTPGTWPDPGNGDALTPFYWGIRATATFTPAAGSTFYGSHGDDATTKITLGPLNWCLQPPDFDCQPPFQPFINMSALPGSEWPLSVRASDSLNRGLAFYWNTPQGPVISGEPSVNMIVTSGIFTGGLGVVCPAGISPYTGEYESWHGSFECLYPDPLLYYVTFKNNYPN